jgi:hypothetical protein
VTPSDVPLMPTGLLVTFSKEILDLLAYIASRGDPKHKAFGD